MNRNTVLITGLGGTLGPRLARAVVDQGDTVIGWNRAAVDPEHAAACRAWLDHIRPDAIFHLAVGSVSWSALLAKYAATHNIAFVFTSSAMVFHHEPTGPHHVDAERTAQDDYGRYKIACEDAIREVNPAAVIARIGWQIDASQPGNNMLMALDQWQQRDGHVSASRAWQPACSFMEDTAAALVRLGKAHLSERAPQASLAQHPLQAQAPLSSGAVHLDSNASAGHSFDQIATALKHRFARHQWIIRVHEDYRHDQRLVGGSELLPPLSNRLPLQ